MFNLIDRDIINLELVTKEITTKNKLDKNNNIEYKKEMILDKNKKPITVKRPKLKDDKSNLCELDENGEVIFEDINLYEKGDPIVEVIETDLSDKNKEKELHSFIENKRNILKNKSLIIVRAISNLLEDGTLGIIELNNEDKEDIKTLKLLIKNVIMNCNEETEINNPVFYQDIPDILESYIATHKL